METHKPVKIPKDSQQSLNERLQVFVRVRPLHPEIELGHEHIITSTEKELTVKSELHHDVKSQFDVVL